MVWIVDELPKGPTGKILKREIKVPVAELTAPVRVELRPACEPDVELIHSLIVALAEYEREPDAVVGTPAMLRRWLFGDAPAAEAVIAEVDG